MAEHFVSATQPFESFSRRIFDADMPACSATTDADIRSAFHAKYLRHIRVQPNTLVVDELGLAHAKSRVDVAVINGCIHGYEIKSEKDTLDRLDGQIDVYRQTLQKVTIVAARRHVERILESTPHWCGVLQVAQGPRGGISFDLVRNAGVNPDVDLVMMAHLLWRGEVVSLLAERGYTSRDLRQPRKQLYEMLCRELPASELSAVIRMAMMQRQTWRGRPEPE